jgi:hypothetical protein
MEYFSQFPTIEYDGKKLKNITARVDFLKRIKNNVALFQNIIIPDDKRPEDIAQIYYGDSTLYWIILYINDIINPYFDWPLNEDQLVNYIKEKYGVENVYSTKHYVTTEESELGEGVVVNFGTPFSREVTNYEYEFDLNEDKRKIKLLKRSFIPQVLTEFKNTF